MSQDMPVDLNAVCPIRGVLDRLGDRWSLLVLSALEGGVQRFSTLMQVMPDVSRQMLTRTLRRLEADGFISRKIYPVVPPKVEYELTALGRSFLEPMNALIDWADRHHGDIKAARGKMQAA